MSQVRLVVVMDPIEAINPAKDSTLAILLAAQARGWQLNYAELGDLSLRDGVAWGDLAPLEVFDDLRNWFTRGPRLAARLGEFDVILMRKDPPFDIEYIYSTYILERAELAGALVVNRARGLRDINEKVYTAWFPQCCAPTLVTRDMEQMAAFSHQYGKVVCKPLHGMGGLSIFVIDAQDKNARVVF
jgi:glutathione synthase